MCVSSCYYSNKIFSLTCKVTGMSMSLPFRANKGREEGGRWEGRRVGGGKGRYSSREYVHESFCSIIPIQRFD